MLPSGYGALRTVVRARCVSSGAFRVRGPRHANSLTCGVRIRPVCAWRYTGNHADTLTIDEFWYPSDGESANSLDQYGRAVVDESKWPSAKGGKRIQNRLCQTALPRPKARHPRDARHPTRSAQWLVCPRRVNHRRFGGLGRPCAAQRMSQHALSPCAAADPGVFRHTQSTAPILPILPIPLSV